MIPRAPAVFNGQQSKCIYRDGNRTAGVRFGDVLRSTRTTSGIYHQSRSIAWSEAVLQRAAREGIKTLEVVITAASGTVTTYRCTLAAMLQRGTLTGSQRALTLDAWSVNGRQPAETKQQPAPAQRELFAEVTP